MRRPQPAAQPGTAAAASTPNSVAAAAAALSEDTAAKLRRLELVSELFDICNSTSNLNDLMKAVFAKVISSVGAEAGSLWLIDEARTELTCHVAEGPTREKVLGMKLAKGTGVVGYVIDSGEPETVFDTSNDPRFSSSVDQKTGFKTKSMICVPLIVESSAIGAIQVLNKRTGDGRFNDDDLRVLRLLCQSSATPIVNARLRSSEQKVQELSTLLDISREITGTLDLDKCMISVVNLCSKLIPYDRAAIALIDDRKGVVVRVISGMLSVNQNDPDVDNLRRMLDGIAKKNEDVFIPSGKKYLKGESRAPYIEEYIQRYHPGTLAVYRLSDEESQLGLFMMESAKENLVSPSQSERMALLRNMLTVSLRNAQLYNAVPSLSVLSRVSKLKRAPRRALILGLAALAVIAGVLSAVKIEQRAGGACEVAPARKYMLYAQIEGGVVDRVCSSPDGRVKAGDTLVVFGTADLLESAQKAANKISLLHQRLGVLKQESRHSEYQTALLDLRDAEIELQSTRRRLTESAVVSPVDGRLLTGDIHNLVGRRFSRGADLVEVMDVKNMNVVVKVPEGQIRGVQLGQPCRMHIAAFPSRTFSGTVAHVSFDAAKGDAVTYPVTVMPDSGSQGLLPGMTGVGRIACGKRSALAVVLDKPRSYLARKVWFL